MPKPYRTALMPVGTLIEYDGMKVKKTDSSEHEPFPWTSEIGTPFSDEWAARAIDDGAEIVEED